MHLKNLHFPKSATLPAALLISLLAVPLPVLGHGFAGDRFFPATISTDDPFAASELSLPTVSAIRQPGTPPLKIIDLSADLSVRILQNLALTVGDGYQIQKAANQRALTGFDNTTINILYEFFENDKHETITSVGLTWEIGGTGRRSLGADSFSTFTPTDKRNVHIDGSNPAVLEVALPPLKPGKYKVIWRAVSVDTHVTTGNFTFEVTP
ncbi:MAG: copper resistance protein CopC [Chthoniobacterales bacterium]